MPDFRFRVRYWLLSFAFRRLFRELPWLPPWTAIARAWPYIRSAFGPI